MSLSIGRKNQLINFLKELLSKNIEFKDESGEVKRRPIVSISELTVLTTDAALVIFDRAFTHQSYDSGNNYEGLEYLGDQIAKICFTLYLERFVNKDLSESELTELSNFYIARSFQPILADTMGLTKLLLHSGSNNAIINLKSDIFESFIGAIGSIANPQENTFEENVLRDGDNNEYQYCKLDYTALCIRLMYWLFTQHKIDLKYAEGAPKTQVQQIFTRFGMKPPIEEYKKSGRNEIVSIFLDNEHLNFLRSHGLTYMGDTAMIASHGAPGKDVASREAYTQALALLAKSGITTEWAVKTKLEQDLNSSAIINYKQKFINKYTNEGYDLVEFDNPRKQNIGKSYQLQLIGTRRSTDGTKTKTTLTSGTFNKAINKEDRMSAELNNKLELIKEYLNRTYIQ